MGAVDELLRASERRDRPDRPALALGRTVCDPALMALERVLEGALERLRVAESRLRAEGACMACLYGPPGPHGCTDCLNTGYGRGERPAPPSGPAPGGGG